MPSVGERANLLNALLKRVSLRVLVAALLAASVVLSSRAADDPAKALHSEFEAARAALAAGDIASAENRYIDTVALGLRQLAQLSLQVEKTDEAAAYLDYALKLKPGDVESEVDAAGIWFRKGEVGKATALLKSVVAQEPSHARARGLLGRIYMFDGDSDNAIQELKSAVDLNYDFETAYFLGIAYLKARKLTEASVWFQQIESTMGDSAALHVMFGRAYLITKFPQQAIPEFRKAIGLDPKYPRAHGFLGYAYLEHYQDQGYPQAREEFEKELKFHPNEFQVLELLGLADVNLRDFPAAEAALLRAERLRPREASVYLYLGETYTATNRNKNAIEVLEKYIEIAGNTEDKLHDVSRAYFMLGHNLRRLGFEQEARKALARSQELREAKFKYDVKHIFDEKKTPESDGESRVSDRVADLIEAGSAEEKLGAQTMIQHGLPAGPVAQQPAAAKETVAAKQYRAFVEEILGSSCNDLGVMRAQASKFTEAAEFFEHAAAWKPDLPGLDRNWGLASYRAELYSEAVPPLERQLAAHPEDQLVRQLLGMSYFVVDNFSKTTEVFQPFLKAPPNDPGLLLAWGTALVRTRRSEHAARIFRILLEQNAANPAVHVMLGQAYAQQKDYENALEELSAASRLDAKTIEAHYYAGLVHLHQSDFEKAAEEFRAELELRPGDPVTNYHLGYALLAQGNAEKAVEIFQEVTAVRPDYEFAHFELGRALLQLGDVQGAIASLEAAKKLVPDRDATYFQLSQAYRRAGRTAEGEQALATYGRLIEESRAKKRKSLEMEAP